jgi:FtsH-binding integral membrane protein
MIDVGQAGRMAQVWNWMWLTVAFLAELAALTAFAVWGWSAGGSTGSRLLLAVAAPAVAGVLWGVFAAPHAPVQVAALTLLVKLVVFGGATLALVATAHPRLAIALAAAALLSSVLSTPPTAVAAPH